MKMNETYLIGTVSVLSENGDPFVTKGKNYKIIHENDYLVEIIDDSTSSNTLSVNPKDDHYLGKWFYLTTEEYLPKNADNESLLKILNLAMIHLPTSELRIEARDLLRQLQ